MVTGASLRGRQTEILPSSWLKMPQVGAQGRGRTRFATGRRPFAVKVAAERDRRVGGCHRQVDLVAAPAVPPAPANTGKPLGGPEASAANGDRLAPVAQRIYWSQTQAGRPPSPLRRSQAQLWLTPDA